MEMSGGKNEFFFNYKWCLNPILTFSELLDHLKEETERFAGYDSGWQREESKVNIYLFTCAIDCAVADYLSRRSWHLAPLSNRFPAFRLPVSVTESVLNFPEDVNAFMKFYKLRHLQTNWKEVVEQVCRFLILQEDEKNVPVTQAPEAIKKCEDGLKKFQSVSLPFGLLNGRMKLNEGFRCQDLTPYDVITMADQFLETNPDKKTKYVIIGSRTAGSYFSPILKIYLEHHGFENVNWIALRPKFGVRGNEKKELEHLLTSDARVILIDDYANTGGTFHKLAGIAGSYGVPSEKMVIMAPIHPVLTSRHTTQEKIDEVLSSSEKTKVIPLSHKNLHLQKLMEPSSVGEILKEFWSKEGDISVAVLENPEIQQINEKLWEHYPDSFQVRLKRVYEVEINKGNGVAERKRILAKSVGVGWLGYHAYLVGEILNQFVPKVIGLRGSILFQEWIDGPTLSDVKVSEDLIDQMSMYLANRATNLAINEDPRAKRPYLGWGWLEILSIFRPVYHQILGYLKYGSMLRNLKKTLHSQPVLVDGRMRRGEWIMSENGVPADDNGQTGRKFLKVDFEHHNFGAPELDVVDPAYDIAITSFEFQLNDAEEARLVSRYSEESGDKDTLSERIFLYKLLYAKAEAGRCLHRIQEKRPKKAREELNRRIQWCWDFRVFTMNKFSASLMKKPDFGKDVSESGTFFMDIDGVFNFEVLGFPHTTTSGLQVLHLLHSNGYTVVPNTGRNHMHVRNYCENFGFDVGIGEYGSVLVDMIHDKEISLISDEAADEIARCRKILEEMDDVFVDSNYQYSVRAFRYTNSGTRGLKKEEVDTLLEKNGFKKLKVIVRGTDTYFMDEERSKGNAIEEYKKRMGYAGEAIIAVGDSDEDISMFENADYAFAPSNCSEKIQQLSKSGKCVIVPHPAQRGLLQIAGKFSNDELNNAGDKRFLNSYSKNSLQHMMIRLLMIAESSRYNRFLSLFI